VTAVNRRAGFTLIEILVVLFIVSILSGIVIARLPRFVQTGDFDTEARRVKQLLDMAREEALLQANEFGFKPSTAGYRFFVYDEIEQKWSELDDRPFQPRQLDEGVELEVTIEDNELALGDGDDETAPPILLLSSGETTPFELTIAMPAEGVSRTLVADGFSELRWQDEAEKR